MKLSYFLTNHSLSIEVFICLFVFQIGLMIGFSATACVFTGIMFIIYCIAVSEFSTRISCGEDGKGNQIDCHLYDQGYVSYDVAKVGAGVGSILLILALVEFIVALTSSVYGCNATCCGGGHTTSGVVQVNVTSGS